MKTAPRRARRWLLRLLVVVLLLPATYYALARGFLGRWIIESILSSRVGATARMDSIHIHRNGRTELWGLRLSMPGIPGTPGRFFEAEKLEVVLDTSNWTSGQIGLRAVAAEGIVARISQDTTTEAVNIQQWRLPSGGGAGRLPRVNVRSGRIELCEHTGETLTILKSMEVRGDVSPIDDDSFSINFQEVRRSKEKPDAELRGMAVGGRLKPDGVELLLQNVSLSDWPLESVPTSVRSLFADLQLTGDISRTRLQYAFQAPLGNAANDAPGVAATLELSNVGVSLPGVYERPGLTAPAKTEGPARLMRVQADKGTLTFASGRTDVTFSGSVEGIPYSVNATYKGTRADSPFEARFSLGEFDLKRDSPVLRFANDLVQERLTDFGNPEGTVKADIIVSRAAGADVKTRGEVRLTNGSAAFHRFPYRFYNLRGLVRFNDDEVIIHRLEGESPSGGWIAAEGRIAPPIADAEVIVKVKAQGIPMDQTLYDALGPQRSRLVERIFHKDSYDRLVARGDISIPLTGDDNDHKQPAPDEPLADTPPAFSLGGTASIGVEVKRELGPANNWFDTVTVDLANAGMLVDRFPYPMRAANLRAVITDGIVKIDRAKFLGLKGGEITVSADVDARRLPEGTPTPEPTIHVEAVAVPIDRALVEALPDKQVEGKSARSVVSALGLTGAVDATAHLAPDSANDLRVRVEVKPRGIVAVPRLADFRTEPADKNAPVAGDLILSGVTGSIIVDDTRLIADISGRAQRGTDEDPDASPQPAAPDNPDGLFRIQADAELSAAGGSDIHVTAQRFDVSLPVERVISIVAPKPASRLLELRDEYRPRGITDIETTVKTSGDKTDAVVDLTNLSGATVALPFDTNPNERAEVQANVTKGSIRIFPGDGPKPTVAQFNDVEATLTSAGISCGTARASGTVGISAGSLAHPADRPTSFKLDWTNAQVGSPLARWVVQRVAGSAAAELHATHKPFGLLDLSLTLGAGGDKPRVQGTLLPRSIRLEMSDGIVSFPVIDAALNFNNNSVSFENARFDAEKWSVTSSGMWTRADTGASEAKATFDISSLGVPEDLKAAAPAGVAEALRDLKVDATGAVRLPNLTLTAGWAKDSNGRPDRLTAAGKIEVTGARADVGVDVTDLTGVIDFEASRDGANLPLRYDLSGLFGSLRLAGIQLTDARARIVSGDKPGETYIPQVSGDCHQGRLTASASIFPKDSRNPDADRDFDAKIALSGVTLGPLIADLRSKLSTDRPTDKPKAPAAMEAPLNGPPTPGVSNSNAPVAATDNSTADSASKSLAKLDVGMTLAGTIGKAETRRGRGTANAGQGTLVSLPLLTRLAEASNFQLPTGEPLDLLQSSFFVQGRTISFEELSIFSASLEFLGFGTLAWPDMNLDMVFTHRATNRLPIIGHIAEGLRNEFAATTVGGTLSDPTFGVSTMRGTRSVLDRIFGGPTTLQERRMKELEERGQRGTERVRIETRP
ncbi:MAG: hypothetical protein K2Y21_07770 [Phycisphaerales bacterium]|nr:hypothetical protein [Phycisphaerales bacterium]